MMPVDGTPASPSSLDPSEGRLADAIARCADRENVGEAFEDILGEHPDIASEIRDALGLLQRLGSTLRQGHPPTSLMGSSPGDEPLTAER